MSSDEPILHTPFFRRFTDERARDIKETVDLYHRVRARYLSSPYSNEDAIRDFVLRLIKEIETPLPVEFCWLMDGILQMEDSIFGFPEPNLEHLSLKEQVALNRVLRSKDYFFDHEQKILKSFETAILLIFRHIASQAPQSLAPSPFIIPLGFALQTKQLISDIFGTLWQDEYKENGLFVNLTRKLYFNLCEVSGVSNPEEPNKPYLLAHKNPAPLTEIVHEYLKETPLEEFFNEPIPLMLTHEQLFSHTHIVSSSGGGKTQLLQHLILHLLSEDPRPSIVVVDSQGDLISKLARLDLPFDPTIITPKDAPALNVFDVRRLGSYDEQTREQVTAGVIQTFDFLFSELFALDLTGKQDVFFRFVSRLLVSMPGAMGRNGTLLDMLALMDDPAPYLPAIAKLPDIQRIFFERDFKSKIFQETKEQIRYRLLAILENPTLARIFTSPDTKLDLFDELNSGSLILVDTAKDYLKSASAPFGKLFISLVFQCILERSVVPEGERKDTFLIIDEASEYLTRQVDEMLSTVRKYKCGVVLSHQYLDQLTGQVRSSISANTAFKLCASLSTGDATVMAREMRTTPDYLLSQPRLHFAAFLRGVTPQAVTIPVKVGELERQPVRNDFDALMARNRERVCSPRLAPEQKRVGNVGSEEPEQW